MYYNLWPDLLRLLKKSYLNESGLNNGDFINNDIKNCIKNGYCLKNSQNNLMYIPDKKHEQELEYPAEAAEFAYIASKKALAFNLFGNGKTVIKRNSYGIEPGVYKLSYMNKLPVIATKNSHVSGDVMLYNRENLILGRVRFLEWITLKNEDIREPFLDSSNYFCQDAGKAFSGIFRELLEDFKGNVYEYSDIFCNLDIIHIIKLVIAAYNLICTYETSIKKIIILDVYWKPINLEFLDQYAGRVYLKEKSMLKETEGLKEKLKEVSDLFLDKFNVSIDIKCMDMWKAFYIQEKTKDEIKWMSRFMV